MAPPPPPPSPDEPEPEWKSRARRDEKIAALIVGSLVALMVAAGVATGDDDVSGPKAEPTATPETLAVREGEILFEDDFSDSTSGWATGVSEEGEVGYVEGAYRIFAKAGRQVFSEFEGSRVQRLRLEFEATQLAGTSGDRVGARCYTDVGSDVGYILGIAPAEQGYFIAAFRGDDFRLLESSGEGVEAVRPPRGVGAAGVALPSARGVTGPKSRCSGFSRPRWIEESSPGCPLGPARSAVAGVDL